MFLADLSKQLISLGIDRFAHKISIILINAIIKNRLLVEIVKLCRLLDEKPGVSRTMANQLLRAGTSIGANVKEGQAGQNEADFIAKYSIACKEARETHYWLRLLATSEIVTKEQ